MDYPCISHHSAHIKLHCTRGKNLSIKQSLSFILTPILINIITFLFSSILELSIRIYATIIVFGVLWIYYTNKLL
jgi:hypothetical protein